MIGQKALTSFFAGTGGRLGELTQQNAQKKTKAEERPAMGKLRPRSPRVWATSSDQQTIYG